MLRKQPGDGSRRKPVTRLPNVLADWPDDSPKPSDLTLRRQLQPTLEDKRIDRHGAGTKNKPYRYWVKKREKEWKADPFGADELMKELIEGMGMR